MVLGNTAAGIIAMETGAKGPNYGVQTACATATHALGDGLRLLRNGDADVMVCGGSEAPLTPLSFAGFQNLMAMNFNYNDDPTRGSRPFDLNRGGFVMAEVSWAVFRPFYLCVVFYVYQPLFVYRVSRHQVLHWLFWYTSTCMKRTSHTIFLHFCTTRRVASRVPHLLRVREYWFWRR
jgi:hypothetical protein